MHKAKMSQVQLDEILEKHNSKSDLNLNLNLKSMDLSELDFRKADLSNANFEFANLQFANLDNVNLESANLQYANLFNARLIGANLTRTNLECANIVSVDLSCCTGLLNAAQWLKNNFQFTDRGIIVYKATGDTMYTPNPKWKIEAGEYLEEVVNPNRTDSCGCGVNFATKSWCEKNYSRATIWQCLIEWEYTSTIVVSYNTDGKARCEKLKLLKVVS